MQRFRNSQNIFHHHHHHHHHVHEGLGVFPVQIIFKVLKSSWIGQVGQVAPEGKKIMHTKFC
jgi:hypothetical protein